MKNTKIIAGVIGLIALFFGFASKGKVTTDFQKMVSKVVKVDTTMYLAENHTIGNTPSKTIG
jgi:hypothetical protein